LSEDADVVAIAVLTSITTGSQDLSNMYYYVSI